MPRPPILAASPTHRTPRSPADSFPRQGRRGFFGAQVLRDLGIDSWRQLSLLALDVAALIAIVGGVALGMTAVAVVAGVL